MDRDPSQRSTVPGVTKPQPQDEWSPPTEVEEYRLLAPLGAGAMGQVFLAHDTLLDRKVAVKFVAGSQPDRVLREQFFVEARAIARLSHPNVVTIHRVGEVRRRPYLVSELVRGQNLAELPRPLDGARLLDIGIGLSRGLAAAHRRGVLHRDLKPANVMITEEGEVKLLDFGLAQLVDQRGAPSSELPTSVVGSPLYMAPEIWRGEPATRASDIYSVGVLLYELAAGKAPHEHLTVAELPQATQEPAMVPLGRAAPELDPRLAALIMRCLSLLPGERPDSGDALRDALEALSARERGGSFEGDPYRGLSAFEAEHQGLFFGRESESRAIVDRLRSEPFVVVAGDSGVGKSSLCRAGVLPRLERQVVQLVPGRRPLEALAVALAPVLGIDEAELGRALRAEPAMLGRELRRRGPTVVFVDQLEELATLAPPSEAAIAAEVLAALVLRAPEVRLLTTVRSDFLTRLAALPGLGPEIARALYLLPPLSPEGVRRATSAPALAKGFRFESTAMVDALSAVAEGVGGLPLLQFALAELWNARDLEQRLLPAAALERMGGPAGALARHADGVLAALLPEVREAARRILLALVTADGMRSRRTHDELERGEPVARAALEALVRGRLVVAREDAYEIAHEALVARWDTLRSWLSQDAERRAIAQRLERAAAEWERLGRTREALWGKRQLDECARIKLQPDPREHAFLLASRRAQRRRRGWRWAAALGLPAIALGLYAASGFAHRRELRRRIGAHVQQAETALASGNEHARAFARLRAEAFAAFDAMKREGGEEHWRQALSAARLAVEEHRQASDALETALRLDSGRADVRARFADVLTERARLAEATFQLRERDEILVRLALNDEDGSRRARWNAPGRLELSRRPAGLPVQLYRFVSDEGRRRLEPLGEARSGELAPGSYLAAAGELRYPFVLERGERLAVALEPQRAGTVPTDFVYVPAGRFFFGSSGNEEARRDFYGAPPLHAVSTRAYLIARHETTYAEWIGFLEALSPQERARYLPEGGNFEGVGVSLHKQHDGWELELRPKAHVYRARWGEPIRYRDRQRRREQDWRRMPVSGISFADAEAYARWLADSGHVPGARLCSEVEWERAARGADDREFPHGDRLEPDDANFDATYGQKLDAFGPDEVGQHPASVSPFGLEDMVGNIFEWTRSSLRAGEAVVRGACYEYGSVMMRVYNREVINPGDRTQMIGVRICATAN
jgi:formylglycine-generating enzyme required for sulfatase activity